ncbi:unnamed protein product [Pleuronectes platessa]|uniref:Uncharacterized protein n=1 Tax=Pleuronectes platessa TaxID=8262 RepID=A0A9N7TWX4_PLEPL|nr:unnamed protein product [Pleuronectes platessa]
MRRELNRTLMDSRIGGFPSGVSPFSIAVQHLFLLRVQAVLSSARVPVTTGTKGWPLQPKSGCTDSPKSMEEEEQEEHCQSQIKATSSWLLVCMFLTKLSDSTRGHEGPTSSNGTCAHSPGPCSSIDIHQRTPELAVKELGNQHSSNSSDELILPDSSDDPDGGRRRVITSAPVLPASPRFLLAARCTVKIRE